MKGIKGMHETAEMVGSFCFEVLGRLPKHSANRLGESNLSLL
jgi:hypothetical protein